MRCCWEAAYEQHWRGYVESVVNGRFGAAEVRAYEASAEDLANMERLFALLQDDDPPSLLDEGDGSYEYHTPANVSFEYSTPGPRKKRLRPSSGSKSSFFPEFDSKELQASLDDVSMTLCRRMASLSPITGDRSGTTATKPLLTSGTDTSVIPFRLPDDDEVDEDTPTPTLEHLSRTLVHASPAHPSGRPPLRHLRLHMPPSEKQAEETAPEHALDESMDYSFGHNSNHDDEDDDAGVMRDELLQDAPDMSILLSHLGMMPSLPDSEDDRDDFPQSAATPQANKKLLQGRHRLKQAQSVPSKKTKALLRRQSVYSEVSSFDGDDASGDLSMTSPIAKHVQTTRGLALQSATKKPAHVLEPYQERAVDWMWQRERPGVLDEIKGGILADEMGLGKTVSCLALIERSRDANATEKSRPTLIIAPLSLLHQWEREIKHKTSLSVGVYHGTDRKRFRRDPDFHAFDIVLSTYDVLRLPEVAIPVSMVYRTAPRKDTSWIATKRLREEKVLLSKLHRVHWDRVILDEAHLIANMTAARTQASFQLHARARWCVTGTPIQNRCEDLHPLFKFIGIPRIGDETHLASLVDLYLLRRLKSAANANLPEKVDERVLLTFATDAERLWYRQVHHITRREVQETLTKATGLHVFELLLRLRQVCDSPSLLTMPLINEDGSRRHMPRVPLSTKMQTLFDALRAATAAHEPCLVVSEWRSYLDLLREQLHAINPEISVAQLDGRMAPRERAQVVEAYQGGHLNVLFLSLKSGALGLNLTATRRVFVMEPCWNPSLESQAIDRAHRIGQTHRVIVTRYIMKDTIEEKIFAMQTEKRAMMTAVLRDRITDRGAPRALKRKDVIDLVLQ
ncbi:hypothetical protein SPRG_08004 [Saprolegnia parasitica CBS 223.65]|uniref:Uncharacterized protein n=1 Tax=Saprolegnia parasitica (strain CBS 223.65) TaxID=695850 RepID=A0A067CBP1_SAPPC|nr:hypothetical protein SPRG_08004 [Saprolegnia parasitica CBS 223.65]KDO26600.1 hypothetical protein SPRG_08004 [Saprolegnia parasitica CBS 223.65]|eukprot:XP_012202742.1 hypothetical protein SPRG_08004 [Saprolegnia parasitica CBS 223.65]